jgi:putative GTP pyrophosphokinase
MYVTNRDGGLLAPSIPAPRFGGPDYFGTKSMAMGGWVERKFSRMQIEKAGKALINDKITKEERRDALEILDNWRACHSFPMNTFQVALRTNARKVCGTNSVIAQRLKRTPSIIAKLKRQQSMSLKRMQDIAGCRAVVASVEKANYLFSHYQNLSIHHELVNMKDYILEPKPDGYQSIHMVWKFKSPHSETFNDQLVEIQIRSKLQHCWATAVETVDTMMQSRLKFGYASDEWGRFFKLMGAIFSEEEGTSARVEGVTGTHKEVREEAATLARDMNVIDRLAHFGQLFHLPVQLNKAAFYLMVMRPKTKQLEVTGFKVDQIQQAVQIYSHTEEAMRNSPGAQVVLVSAGSVQALKKAYPNYYADTTIFIQHVRRLTKEAWPSTFRLDAL